MQEDFPPGISPENLYIFPNPGKNQPSKRGKTQFSCDMKTESDIKCELARSNIDFSGKTRIRANRQNIFIVRKGKIKRDLLSSGIFVTKQR
jgi:hypothetical protein